MKTLTVYLVPSANHNTLDRQSKMQKLLKRTSDFSSTLNLIVLRPTVCATEGHENDFLKEWNGCEQQASYSLFAAGHA